MPSYAVNKPLTRLSRYNFECDSFNGKLHLAKRTVNRFGPQREFANRMSGRIPYAGSAWWALTGDMVRRIRAGVGHDPDYTQVHGTHRDPGELFFQTLMAAMVEPRLLAPSLMYDQFSEGGRARPVQFDEGESTDLIGLGGRHNMNRGAYGSG